MATSTFGWLDYDEAERRRVLELVDLFREKGTLDELGLGTIRDTFADHFFPGISTIQTRARYFLFIPWIYQQIEGERIPHNQIDRRTRELQFELVQSLIRGGENDGVIGIAAGRHIQRPPSTIYWLGLKRWGIRLLDGSDERYYAAIDTHASAHRRPRRGENDELLDAPQRVWHGGIPSPPPDLFEASTFALGGQEAMYLHERIQKACGGSLLAACLNRTVTHVRTASGIWDLGHLDNLAPQLREDVRLAELFSLGMEGATLLYNLMLAEKAISEGLEIHGDRVDLYRERLERWADAMIGFREVVYADDIVEKLKIRIFRLNPRIHRGAIEFSTRWLITALLDPRSLAEDEPMRQTIRARERRLKGSLARLSNPRALENWSGASGLGRMEFRWSNARRIIMDIQTGLRSMEEVA